VNGELLPSTLSYSIDAEHVIEVCMGCDDQLGRNIQVF